MQHAVVPTLNVHRWLEFECANITLSSGDESLDLNSISYALDAHTQATFAQVVHVADLDASCETLVGVSDAL